MGRETRDRIVESAALLFGERGFDGTSVAMVLDHSGVNSGSLYHFFDSKEALALAVAERCIDRLTDGFLGVVEGATDDPMGRLTVVLARIRDRGEWSGLEDGVTLWLLAGEVGDRLPSVRAAWVRYHGELIGSLRSWLDGAGPRLPSYLDRTGFADYLATVLLGGLSRARAAGGPRPLETAVDQLEQHLGLLLDAARYERTGELIPAPEALGRRPEIEPPADWRSW